GCTPGSTVTLTVTYPSALPAGTQYWKYGPKPPAVPAAWYVFPATIVGNTATFTITDGGAGDDDLAANGTIVDAGGPGAAVAVVGTDPFARVPTLSEWALMMLGGLMLMAAMAMARRRKGAVAGREGR